MTLDRRPRPRRTMSSTPLTSGAEHLDALEAEGVPVGGRARGDDGRDQRDDQGDRVAGHVAGVGEQRERSRERGADDLGDRGRRR